MKKGVLGLVILFMCFNSRAQKKLVEVNVTCTQAYCGGARPTDEMLAEIQKPKPYANKKMYLLSEKGKKIAVKTNSTGSFKVKVAHGNYKLMELWRIKNLSPNGAPLANFDMDCLKPEWEKEVMVIRVTKEKIDIEPKNEITLSCDWAFPCLKDAHMPPMPE